MLEKIIKLENVGLLAKPLTKAIELKQTTLVYADNGRGKSTLCAVLRACSTADAQAMLARTTIGGSGQPAVQLRFNLPTGGTTVSFDKGAWNAAVPNILVFDQTFIERNVYAGGTVGAEHHQGLLDFALGAASVEKKKQVNDASAAQIAATKARTAAEAKLQGYRGAMLVKEFLALPEEPDAHTKIAECEKRLANAKASEALSRRTSLKPLQPPMVDFSGFEAILRSSFKQVQENAEALVKAHLEKHGGVEAQQWLSDGQRFNVGKACPFCGQAIGGLELITAYGSYFNEQYAAHSEHVASLPDLAQNSLTDAVVTSLVADVQVNADRIQVWAEQLTLDCPAPVEANLRSLAKGVRYGLSEAAAQKQKQPLEPVSPEVLNEAIAAHKAFSVVVAAYNKSVDAENERVAKFKATLQSENQVALAATLARLRSQKLRHSTEVVSIAQEHQTASDERDAQEDIKSKTKAELDQLMASTLGDYQVGINKWLDHLRTPFRISKLKVSYVGGTMPRTEYGVVVRNKHVAAGKAMPAEPSFNSVLSDGDKRSLALAFFLAKALHQSTRADHIVVLDDVFASLDSNRRAQTIAAMHEVAKHCSQLVVLAHDAYFLHELQRVLVRAGVSDILPLQIRRVGELSDLVTADFAAMCESDYYKQYKTVYDYLNGPAPANLTPVAQALRPLVEGNLHRRFPGHIPDGLTVGDIITRIENSSAGSTLTELQPEVQKLRLFNQFAAAFHHNTEGRVVRATVTDGELNPWAKSTLHFVHLGVMP